MSTPIYAVSRQITVTMMNNLTHKEEAYFTTIVLDVSSIRQFYVSNFHQFKSIYGVKDDEFEDAYDWMVTEAISNILIVPQNSTVRHHYKHDVYRSLYDHFKNTFELYIKCNKIAMNLLYAPGTKVKLLVTGPALYLVKQGVINE